MSPLLTFILKDEFHIKHELELQTVKKKKKKKSYDGKYLKEPHCCFPNTLPPNGQFCLFAVFFKVPSSKLHDLVHVVFKADPRVTLLKALPEKAIGLTGVRQDVKRA